MRRPRRGVKRHHWIVRLTHWLNAIALTGLIASGLQIYQAFPHFGQKGRVYPVPNPFDMSRVPKWSRLGGWLAGGLQWHFALAWLFLISGVLYLASLLVSGEWRSLLFRPRDVGPATQMQLYYLRLRQDHPPQGKHNALQKGAYTFVVALGAPEPHRLCHLQAGTALMAHRAVRRLRAGALLALRGGVALRRLHAAARGARVPGGSRVAPRHDHRLVPWQVSQSWLSRHGRPRPARDFLRLGLSRARRRSSPLRLGRRPAAPPEARGASAG